MKFEDALFIYPEAPQGAPSYRYYPPLGLETVATAVQDCAIPVAIVDRRYDLNIAPFLKEMRQLVGISVNWDYEVLSLPLILKDIPEQSEVILGGRAATTHVDEIFRDNPSVSCIVRGDGEEIVRDIAMGKNYDEIEGISFRRNGSVIHNRTRDLQAMDDSLIVNRLLRRQRYASEQFDIELDFISTSRGCPYHCKFCNFSNNPLGQKRKWTGRSPESVIKELESMKSANVLITDDNFAVDMKRVEKICDLIIEKGIRKNIAAAVRIDISKYPAIVDKMYQAGIKVLMIGFESATNRVLEMISKGFITEEAIEAMKIIRRKNFYIHGYFIIGNFTETREDMLKIIDYAGKLDLDTLDAIILRTDKYSPINDIILDYPDYHIVASGSEMQIYSDNYSIQDLVGIRNEITRRYFTPGRIFRTFRRMLSLRVFGGVQLLKYVSHQINKSILPLFLKKDYTPEHNGR
ncbi:MAG: radical SAM protein [Vulcanimicrobiota bacterium]